MEPEASSTSRWRQSIGLFVVLAFSALAAVRVAHMALLFVPQWLALAVAAMGGLEVLSVAWNAVRGEPWDERTFFSYIADAVVWLPWP